MLPKAGGRKRLRSPCQDLVKAVYRLPVRKESQTPMRNHIYTVDAVCRIQYQMWCITPLSPVCVAAYAVTFTEVPERLQEPYETDEM